MRFRYGDPDELDRLAGILCDRADAVRRDADDQLARARAARWVSVSAHAYRQRLADRRVEADRSAAGLEAAAAALREHAQEIRELLAAIARAEREVTEWFGRAERDVVGAVDSLVRGAAHGDPPWSGWPYTPLRLPASGDKGWLDAGRFLRGQGVL